MRTDIPQLKSRPVCQYQVDEQSDWRMSVLGGGGGVGGWGVGIAARASLKH